MLVLLVFFVHLRPCVTQGYRAIETQVFRMTVSDKIAGSFKLVMQIRAGFSKCRLQFAVLQIPLMIPGSGAR